MTEPDLHDRPPLPRPRRRLPPRPLPVPGVSRRGVGRPRALLRRRDRLRRVAGARRRTCSRPRVRGCACDTSTSRTAAIGSRVNVLILAFDTATSIATSALVRDGEVLGERAAAPAIGCSRTSTRCCARPARAGGPRRRSPSDRPGQLHRRAHRPRRRARRSRSRSASRPPACRRSTPCGGAPGAAVIDARRREVFTRRPGERARPPSSTSPGQTLRRRRRGALPRALRGSRRGRPAGRRASAHSRAARFHARSHGDFGPAELVEPLYLRAPDAIGRLP